MGMDQSTKSTMLNYSRRGKYKYGDNLYHYTNAIGLNGILKGKMWMSSANSTNDRKEFIGFFEGFENYLISQKGIDTEEVKEYFFRLKRSQVKKPYIFCLSSAYDDAAQWERYADNGKGFCISFNTEQLLNSLCYSKGMFGQVSYKYDFEDNVYCNELKNLFLSYPNEKSKDKNSYFDNLIISAYFYKHRSFEAEKEVRYSTLFDKKIKYSENDCKVVGSRLKDVVIVDMKALCKDAEIDFEDLFDEIIISPRSVQEPEEIKNCLSLIGINKKIRVTKSESPLR